MVSIIRSPAISDERRKLTNRRTRASAADTAAAPAPDAPPAIPAPAALPGLPATAVAPPSAPPQPRPAPSAPPHAAPAPPAPDMNALMAQARQSALAQVKEDAEKARELGRQRGLQEGRESGAAEARKTVESELARVRAIAASLQEATANGFKGLEEMAVAIAFEAVCKMMGSAAVTRDGIEALVGEAASHAINNERVVVRLHPGDLSALRDAGALGDVLASGVLVSWSGDKQIELGGCIVETDSGELDARLETQMARLRAALLAARRQPD